MQSVTQEKVLILVTFNIIQCHITIFYSGVDTINPRPAGPLDFPPPAGGGRLNAPPP